MPSSEEPHAIIEKIIPRMEEIEKNQEILRQSYLSLENRMDAVTNQMKAMELSNNDIKNTVVGYGQTHSMLIKTAMDSLVQINASNTQIVREVQTTKDKIEGNVQVARLGTKEKVLVSVVGLISAPSMIAGLGKAGSFVIDFLK